MNTLHRLTAFDPAKTSWKLRWLLPVVLALPFLLGAVTWIADRAGIVSDPTGFGLVSLGAALGLAAVFWWASKSVRGSERYQREQRLLLESFFSLSFDMLCIAGFDGYFKQVNAAWTRTLGYSEYELLAQPYLTFVHPDDRDATIGEDVKLTGEGTATVAFENRYRCKDGTYKWLLWNATPVPERNVIFAVARDVTELKEAEREVEDYTSALERSNKELEDFTYVVSHDLKEPLRTIEAFSSFLARDLNEQLDDEGRRYIGILQESAVRMRDLIEDLLELSRVGRQELQMAPVDMENLVDAIKRELGYALEAKAATLHVSTSLPAIHADQARLKQVVQNLISNAIKYNENPEPRIDVAWHEDDEVDVFSIRDNGIGIDEKYHDKIFQIFQRLHGQDEYEGTGAGLTICKKIVEAHGGTIWLESEPGQGSTFSFAIPKRTEQALAA